VIEKTIQMKEAEMSMPEPLPDTRSIVKYSWTRL